MQRAVQEECEDSTRMREWTTAEKDARHRWCQRGKANGCQRKQQSQREGKGLVDVEMIVISVRVTINSRWLTAEHPRGSTRLRLERVVWSQQEEWGLEKVLEVTSTGLTLRTQEEKAEGEHTPFGGAVLMGTGVRGANRKPEECCATKAKNSRKKWTEAIGQELELTSYTSHRPHVWLFTLQLTKIK